MADAKSSMKSSTKKELKKPDLTEAEIRKAAWERAEKTLLKGKYEGALDTLRSIDGEGQHPTTLRIAGEATWAKAKDTRSKSDYRKAASLFRDSMKGNSKDKRTNTQYNDLLNEMQDARISETVFPRLARDGTPTLAGVFAFGAGLLLILAAISVLSAPKVDGENVVFDLSWTNPDGSFETGSITIELYADAAPTHVENFKELVRDGSYDSTIFHRIIADFMLQGGDFTNGDGTGGHAAVWDGYCNGSPSASSSDCSKTAWTIGDEASNGLKHEPYMLSMAKTSNDHTGGSQFFIVSPGGSPPSHLDGVHTVFGKVIGGQDVVDKIDAVGTEGQSGSDPVYPVTLVDASFSGGSSSPWWQIW
ncbi:MAG: peptidylprolyl isomerase [Candidatus Poseidoniaceae archaeon]|nr:peptidylprolyl isomerase [Candidatus Poseidoniaceae archaeon]